jgi:hypothetical protein
MVMWTFADAIDFARVKLLAVAGTCRYVFQRAFKPSGKHIAKLSSAVSTGVVDQG